MVGLITGNIIGLLSIGYICLLLINKITLSRVEFIVNVAKFEGFIYLIFLLIFILEIKILFDSSMKFGISIFGILVLILSSFINYSCFKSSFYSKLRIKSRKQLTLTNSD